MQQEVTMELKDISKSFADNVVLDHVSMDLKSGEILTLLGENGAGKSTLLNIISGSLKMDGGSVLLHGSQIDLHNPSAAKKMGIIKVHQELQVIPELTVAENVYLHDEIINPRTKTIWYRKMQEETDRLLAQLDAGFSSKTPVKKLNTAQKQLVEIAKALLHDFSVLILDEPTSSLTNKEITKLFGIMRMLREQGKAIIFVSHRIPEVFEISDRIAVLRDGHLVNVVNTAETCREDLIRMMTGRDLSQQTQNRTTYDENDVILSVKNLSSFEGRFRDISFDLHRGEILGLAGLVGAGRTEIVRAIFGADPIGAGEVYIKGKRVNIKSPKKSMEEGLAFIPEDRKLHGMVGIISNRENINLCSYDKLKQRGRLSRKKEQSNADIYMKKLHVHPANLNLHTSRMSGGNQQKVIIGKWLSMHADIIIMDEPTRGIDVGAKDEIYQLMLELISQGISILMISSDMPEVLSMSSRILVINEGKISGELMHDEATETKILNLAMGGH